MPSLKRMINRPLRPDGSTFRLLRGVSHYLDRAGVLKPNNRFSYIFADDAVLLLTPLSGSSSIVLENRARVRTSFERRPKKYMLWRPDLLRMQSAYNKKIHNPASVLKSLQLSTFGGLGPKSSVEDFAVYLERMAGNYNKDKHFFLNREILSFHGLAEAEVEKLDIRADSALIRDVFGINVSARRNSTAEKSTYQDVVTLSEVHAERIASIEALLTDSST